MVTYDEINPLPSRKLTYESFILIRMFLGLPLKERGYRASRQSLKPLYHKTGGRTGVAPMQLSSSATGPNVPYQTWRGMLLGPVPPEPMVSLPGFPAPNSKGLLTAQQLSSMEQISEQGTSQKGSCGKPDNQTGALYTERTPPEIAN